MIFLASSTVASASRASRGATTAPGSTTRIDGEPPRLIVTEDGRALALIGALVTGTAERIALALEGAPEVRVLALDSEGGGLVEAYRVAELVRARRLDTYVERLCVSACTIVLLAGADRAASPNAAIGFHRPQPLRSGAAEEARVIGLARALYEQAGVARRFVDRVLATPYETVWQPSYAEMHPANILTRRTLGGETAVVATQWNSRGAIAEALRAERFWQALAEHRPALAEAVVDAAWSARQAGGSDAQVLDAGRARMIAALPGLLAGASDTQMHDYWRLSMEQLAAARALGPEACARLLSGRLNVQLTLPPELHRREEELIVAILEASEGERTSDPGLGAQLLEEMLTGMDPRLAQVIRQPEPETGAAEQCEAMGRLAVQVDALSWRSRIALIRYLFAGEGQS